MPLKFLPLLVFAAAWAPVPASAAGAATAQTLAADRGCMACHGLLRKQVGPGFAQVAERYRGDAEAPARIAARIRSGGVGNWGRVIMPRQRDVSEAEAALLAGWILALPSPTAPSQGETR
jgi:cytochrome c